MLGQGRACSRLSQHWAVPVCVLEGAELVEINSSPQTAGPTRAGVLSDSFSAAFPVLVEAGTSAWHIVGAQ